MFDCHHDFRLFFGRGNFEFRRNTRALDDERMIPHPDERRRNPAKQSFFVVNYFGSFAVKNSGRGNNFAAERVANTLMPEAHPENRRRGELANYFGIDAEILRIVGSSRSGGNDDVRRRELADFLNRKFVVAENDRIRTELAQKLEQIKSERVVIIDN